MRLTEKFNGKYCYKNQAFIHTNIVDKLGQLEDIEDELGIDLIILFKALKNGFYTKNAHYTGNEMGINVIDKCLCNEKWRDRDIFNFKDYGKTWALTKEELE